MELKSYPEYQDSGVEWIGEIPKNWTVKRLKYLSKIFGRIGFRGYNVSDLVGEGEGALTLGGKHISKNNELDLSNPEYLSWEKYYESPEIMVQKGDIIITQRGTLGKSILIDKEIGPATINPSMLLLKKIELFNRYLYYFLISDYSKRSVELSTAQTAVPMISQEQVGNFLILNPSINEQKQIVSFLDKKTSEIDKTIGKDAQLIELLKEKRTALINHVVTKGIDPDAKMKDSGVEWIGEIPEGWEIRKFSHISDEIVVGYVGSIEKYYTDETGIPLLKTGNVGYGKINTDNLSYVTPEFHLKNKKSQLKPGDIVIARHGESGRCSVVPPSIIEANCLNIVVLKKGKDMLGNFYAYLLNSHIIQEHLQSIQGGAVQGVVNTEDIAYLKVFYPPLEEQNKIVSYIDDEITKMDNTVQKIKNKIELMEEYKKSLIHHVITGKVDVRGDDSLKQIHQKKDSKQTSLTT